MASLYSDNIIQNVNYRKTWGVYDKSTHRTRQRSKSFSGNELVKALNGNVIGTAEEYTGHMTEKPNTISEIKTYLKPLLVCLSICGCYNFFELNRLRHTVSAGKNSIVYIYRTLLFFAIVLALVKFVAAFFYLSKPNLFANGLYVIWLSLCASHFLVHLKSTTKRFGNQEETFKKFDIVLNSFHQIGISYPEAKIKRRVVLGTIIGCAVVVVNMAGVCLQVVFHNPSKSFYSSPFDTNWISLSFFLLAQLISTCIWLFPCIYAATICNIIKHTFNAYNVYLRDTLCRSECTIPVDIRKTRQLHLKLCDVVSGFDADLGWFFACSCCFNIGLSSVALYQIVKAPLDSISLFLFLFWLSSSMGFVGAVAIFAAIVNERAHAPLDIIYYIDVKDASLDQVTQLNLFLSKLTGTQVGFTTCGLLTITKEFILTIAGVFLTYFAVLYTL